MTSSQRRSPASRAKQERLLLLLEEQRRRHERNRVFQPQPGPQTAFLRCTADIALYGGAAGGGKTYALLLECLRHIDNSEFGAVVFRRTSPEITAQGGLWDNAFALYPLRGGRPKQTPQLMMRFPSGARVEFRHLQHEPDVHAWQGSQIPLIAFDELTHFTRKQFFYLLSRNRSVCGVRPYMRATTNPDADSWVADFITWWIDQDPNSPRHGLAIPERSGVVRYFAVVDDNVVWGDDREALARGVGLSPDLVKSFTFIASSVFDNKILLEQDPGYLANLHALGTVDKARLLGGNWKIRPATGLYFRRDQVRIVPALPADDPIVKVCRAWDFAATERTPNNPSPDATSGTLIARLASGLYAVLDNVHGCWSSDEVERQLLATSRVDRGQYPSVIGRIPQDPGQAGKVQVKAYTRLLAGLNIKAVPISGNKVVRATPFSAQWMAGNVILLRGGWNDRYLTEMEAFPDGVHDDDVDSSADAFDEVALNRAGSFADVRGLRDGAPKPLISGSILRDF